MQISRHWRLQDKRYGMRGTRDSSTGAVSLDGSHFWLDGEVIHPAQLRQLAEKKKQDTVEGKPANKEAA